jgi:hypothetical protein
MKNELTDKWLRVIEFVSERFQKTPDMSAVIFLIGMRELGTLTESGFSKEEKVKLMHIAVCKILSYSNYYILKGSDEDGWPDWELVKPLPPFDIFQQEIFLKQHIVEYFEQEEILIFEPK